jgi:hypothetical protein
MGMGAKLRYRNKSAHICRDDEQCIYYHATFSKNEIPILLEGLRVCKPRLWEDHSCKEYNYVASKPETALRWIVAWYRSTYGGLEFYGGRVNTTHIEDGATIFEVDVSGMEITIRTPWNVLVLGDIAPERIKVYKQLNSEELAYEINRTPDISVFK